MRLVLPMKSATKRFWAFDKARRAFPTCASRPSLSTAIRSANREVLLFLIVGHVMVVYPDVLQMRRISLRISFRNFASSVGKGLVEEQARGRTAISAGQGDALLLAAGIARWGDAGRSPSFGHRQRLVQELFLLGGAQRANCEAEADIFADGHVRP